MTTGRQALLVGCTVLAILLFPVAPSNATYQPFGSERDHVRAGTADPLRLPQPGASGFDWPVDPPITVLRGFDPPPEPWLAGHRGVDLAVRPGQPVRAAGAGVVTFAGPIAGRSVLVIRLAADPTGPASDLPTATAGLRITYEPVDPAVHRGDRVATGQLVGRLANVPHCGVLGSCLHWGLRRGDLYLDPLLLVRPQWIRLLPLDRELALDPWLGPTVWPSHIVEWIEQPQNTWPVALAMPVVSRLPGLASEGNGPAVRRPEPDNPRLGAEHRPISRYRAAAASRTRASRSRPGSCTAGPTGEALRRRSTARSPSPPGARSRSVP